jgi:hypothetical protein
MSRKVRIFRLTWFLGPEGSLEEETRTNSGSVIFFPRGDGGFVRSASGAASPAVFFYESVVCLRVSSWGRTWYWSRSPGLVEVSSVEDLKQASKSI